MREVNRQPRPRPALGQHVGVSGHTSVRGSEDEARVSSFAALSLPFSSETLSPHAPFLFLFRLDIVLAAGVRQRRDTREAAAPASLVPA